MAFNEKLNIFLQEYLIFNRYTFDVMAAFGIKGLQNGNKFGQIIAFSPTDGRIPVWEGTEAYPYQTAPFTPSFASTDVDDTNGGTGAWTIVVEGNDVEGNQQSETITLNGQTPVSSTLEWSSVYRMYTDKAGSETGAEGFISCGLPPFTLGVPDVTLALIDDGNNQTQMALLTVPKGYYCLVTSITYTTISNKPVIFHDEVRLKDGPFDYSRPFRNVRTINVNEQYSLNFNPYGVFPEYSDVRITALATQNDSTCECAFRYILIPKELIEPLIGG